MEKKLLGSMKESLEGTNQKKEIKSLGEKKSEKVGELDSRYNELGKEFQLNKQEREDTLSLGKLHHEGFQTIINTFGVEATFQAIKQLGNTGPKGSAITTYELIRSLEPDAKKRKILYKQMRVDAKQIQGEIKKSVIDSYETGKSRSYSSSVSGSNFERIVSSIVSNYDSLDGVFMNIVPDKFRKYMQGIVDSTLQGFSIHMLQFSDKEKQLKEELSSRDNNIESTLTNRNERSDQREQDIARKAVKMIEDIDVKINAETQASNLRFEQWRTRVVADLKNVKGLETQSEEMGEALKQTLIKIEEEISARKKITDNELKEATSKLANMKQVLQRHF